MYIDCDQRVKYNVPYKVPVELWTDCHVVVANIPMKMAKVRAAYREKMPPWVLTVKELEDAVLFDGPMSQGVGCVVCKATEFVAGLAALRDPLLLGDIFRCKACLSMFHETCAKAVNAQIDDLGAPLNGILPRPFVCGHCRVKQEQYRDADGGGGAGSGDDADPSADRPRRPRDDDGDIIARVVVRHASD